APVEAEQAGVEEEVLADAERPLQPHPSGRRDVGDRALDQMRRGPDRDAVHTSIPFRWSDQAGEDLDQRRLAGAVMAQQPADLAPANLQIDPIEREHLAGRGGGQLAPEIPDPEAEATARGPGPASRGGRRGIPLRQPFNVHDRIAGDTVAGRWDIQDAFLEV